jgi:hypothetical protein
MKSHEIEEGVMMIKYVNIIGLIAVLTIFSGCRATMPEMERNFGKSFEAAKQNQIINPEASKNTSPVIGLDGKSAETAVRKYEKSFGEGQRKETYNLNLSNMRKIGKSK